MKRITGLVLAVLTLAAVFAAFGCSKGSIVGKWTDTGNISWEFKDNGDVLITGVVRGTWKANGNSFDVCLKQYEGSDFELNYKGSIKGGVLTLSTQIESETTSFELNRAK